MYIEQLTGHHEKIWQLIHELQSYKTDREVLDHAAKISLSIAKLSGILSIHLASEDKYLYPTLQKDSNPQICQTAEKFSNEMGHLAEVYSSYKDSFMVASKIQAAPAVFLTETQHVFTVLSERLHREDQELYPLLKE